MKTLTLEIIKKNRRYFAAKHNGYDVKVLIDGDSESLELGTKELLLEDISVRTKYGTDVIYKLVGEAKLPERIVTLKHRYNANLVERCRELGGKFDNGIWVFSALVEDKIEALDYYYNSDEVSIEITAKGDVRGYQAPIYFCGYLLAKASGRDSGAKLGSDFAQISGTIESSGSMKNWTTVVRKGSVFRTKMSKVLLEGRKELFADDFEIKILEN